MMTPERLTPFQRRLDASINSHSETRALLVLIRLDDITEHDTTTTPDADAPRATHHFSPTDTLIDIAHSSSSLPSLPLFYDVLPELFAARKMRLDKVCPSGDVIARCTLEEYGALFVAAESVCVPEACVFANEREVTEFQNQAGIACAMFDETEVQLQPAALLALIAAHKEAEGSGMTITPRGGGEASRRSYEDTLRLWLSRVLPALDFWCAGGRVSSDEADAVRGLPTNAQVAAVLEMEERGIFFSKDFKKSVMRSVALPGTSQHLAMLAFDVTEFRDASVRCILARHGWFQTVLSDMPHFTFLGRAEEELTSLGLQRIVADEQAFYVPRV
ncbi:MAG: hypothetical protein MSG64_00300 [Pyrinomonadaceae bacterium MAG19_C2-C3]|nr:hypothetical protein [Pyrinomonadaceae bacterium MAG19_C2-C3]